LSIFDYPELTVVDGVIYGKSTQAQTEQGKNIVDTDFDTLSKGFGPSYVDFSDNTIYVADSTTPVAVTAYYLDSFHLEAGENYTFSSSPDTVFSNAIVCLAFIPADLDAGNASNYYIATDSRIIPKYNYTGTTFSVTPIWSGYYRVGLYLSYNQAAKTISNPAFQLEEGSTATSYEPFVQSSPSPLCSSEIQNTIEAGTYQYTHNNNIYTVELPVMRSVGDVADTYDVETNKFTQQLEAKICDGLETWTIHNQDSSFTIFKTYSAIPYSQLNQMCSHFSLGGNDAAALGHPNTFVQESSGYLYFQVYNALADTVSEFESWLAAQYAAETPVTVYYQLAAPVTSTITPTLVWEAPVCDHAATDQEYVADFNRQKNNIECAATVICPSLYYFPSNTEINDADRETLPLISLINTLENNITDIENCGVPLPASWQSSETWTLGGDNPDYTDFNRWESNAKLVYDTAESIMARWRPAGTFAAGQSNILPRRAV